MDPQWNFHSSVRSCRPSPHDNPISSIRTRARILSALHQQSTCPLSPVFQQQRELPPKELLRPKNRISELSTRSQFTSRYCMLIERIFRMARNPQEMWAQLQRVAKTAGSGGGGGPVRTPRSFIWQYRCNRILPTCIS